MSAVLKITDLELEVLNGYAEVVFVIEGGTGDERRTEVTYLEKQVMESPGVLESWTTLEDECTRGKIKFRIADRTAWNPGRIDEIRDRILAVGTAA